MSDFLQAYISGTAGVIYFSSGMCSLPICWHLHSECGFVWSRNHRTMNVRKKSYFVIRVNTNLSTYIQQLMPKHRLRMVPPPTVTPIIIIISDNHSIHTLENTKIKRKQVSKGLQMESYLNSGSSRTLLNTWPEPRMAAFTSGANGCLPGSSFKCLYKFGAKDVLLL